MKFIRDLIKNKNWSDDPEGSDFSADNLRKEFAEETGFESPLIGRQSQQAMDFDDDDEWMDDDFDMDAPVAETPEHAPEPAPKSQDLSHRLMASLSEPANDLSEDEAFDDEDVSMIADDEFDDADEEPEGNWNIGLTVEEEFGDANQFQYEPEFDDSDEMEMFEDPLFQDEGSAREIERAAMDAVREQEDLSEREKAALLEEIRRAMHAVRHIRSDEEIGRQNAARDQLGRVADAAQDSRILDETNEIFDEDGGSRRRQAIALMKAAAHATKTDPQLRKLAGRDSALDTAEQSDYRQDLESFAQPSLQTSRPRPVSAEPAPEPMAKSMEAPMQDDTEDQEAVRAVAPKPISKPQRKNVGLNDLPVLERPAKVHSEILRHQARAGSAEGGASGTRDLRAALQEARTPKTVDIDDQPKPEAPVARNIWDIEKDQDEPADEPQIETAAAMPEPAPAPTPIVQVPQPTQGRAGRQAGRVKTRLLGFTHDDEVEDPFAKKSDAAGATAGVFPVGWVVITDGPGRGNSFALGNGVTQIGRGEGQAIRLDFGDLAISRENHAAIAYDDEKNAFFLGHGGKSNLVRLNSSPVLSTETLSTGDSIRIGETTLRFVAFCDGDFDWTGKDKADDAQRAFG